YTWWTSRDSPGVSRKGLVRRAGCQDGRTVPGSHPRLMGCGPNQKGLVEGACRRLSASDVSRTWLHVSGGLLRLSGFLRRGGLLRLRSRRIGLHVRLIGQLRRLCPDGGGVDVLGAGSVLIRWSAGSQSERGAQRDNGGQCSTVLLHGFQTP